MQVGNSDALLLHRVAVADRNGAILQRLEINRQAEGRSDLVLPTVKLANRRGIVVDRTHLAG